GLLNQVSSLLGLQRQRLTGLVLRMQIVYETRPAIPPRLDGELIKANPVGDERGFPAVVVRLPHRTALPCGFTLRSPKQAGGELVVTIRNDIGGDGDRRAHHSLCRKRPVG